MTSAPEKEFGKLSVEQFRAFVKELPEIRSQFAELPRLVHTKTKEEVDALLGDNFVWSAAYEWSFLETLACLLVALGKAADLAKWAESNDPTQALIDDMHLDEPSEWSCPFGGIFTKAQVIGLSAILQRNIQSLMIHHRSINALVAEVKACDANWQEPFFNAVRIDRSVLTCPTFALRLTRAELEKDRHFFLRLRSAIKGPSQKHWQSYQDLRFVFVMLREMGFDRLSDKQMERLLIHELQLYPDTPTALRNLRKQFHASRNFSTT
ncbi:hypothetical protein [Chitinimonas sp. BJYL2]|uniref:hypothetical protein n=1 Tax=Chitinimonas sp. BJYL2 TaxID=2976696 RepID=UPI0022B49DFC|nr:hypothetical protein [Chitinimonas sp. BJYL2]